MTTVSRRLSEWARRHQHLEGLIPAGWRPPLRYHVQHLLGALEPEMALLPALVRADGLAVDAGANMGVYSYRLAALCRRVIAFEPLRPCAEVIAAWAPNWVEVEQVALSAAAGTLTLYLPLRNGRPVTTRARATPPAGAHETLRVPMRRLDEFDCRGLSYLKIDVEGHERSVLDGAAATLTAERPICQIERSESFPACKAFFADRDYSLFAIAPRGRVLWPVHEQRETVNFFAIPAERVPELTASAVVEPADPR